MSNINKLLLVNIMILASVFIYGGILLLDSTPALAVDDRYWIGGTGNYSDTAHWSLSDGGAGGASVPGSGNDIWFTANSDTGAGFTVTINTTYRYCLDWDSSGVDQVMTIAGTWSVGVYGDITWKSDHVNTWTGELWMLGTGGGNTVDLAGVALNDRINFNGAGGDWTLASALTCDEFYVTQGSVDTAGYDLETNAQASLTTSGTLDLDSSTWTYNDDYFDNNVTTFTCGTSTIEFTAADMNFYGGAGNTYYDVEFSGSGYVYYQELNTFHDLTRTATTDNDSMRLYTDTTVTGTFYANGVDEANRVEIRSNTSANRTITAAATSTQYSSWYYITGAGAASWDLTGDTGGAASLGYTTGITYTTDIYFVSGSSLTVACSHTSGGTQNNDWGSGFTNGNPGNTLNLIFDSNSTGSTSIQSLNRYFKDIDASALTNTITLTSGSGLTWHIYGDYTGSSFITGNDNETFGFRFAGGYSHDFDPNGQVFGFTWTLQDLSAGAGCVINLLDDLECIRSYSGIDLYYGLTTNGYDMTFPATSSAVYSTIDFNSSTSGLINLGSSEITCRSFNTDTSNINTGTSTINCHILSGAGATYYIVYMDAYNNSFIDDANTFYDLSVYATNITDSLIEFGADQLVTNDFILAGYNSSTKRLRVASDVGGTQRTIYVNGGYALLYCDVSDIVAAGSTSPWDCSAGLNVDFGNNLYISFTPATNCYWVGNTGNWSDAGHWASSSGGGGGTSRVPIGQDSAIFDANSITLPLQTITMDMTVVPTISAAAIANNPTFSGSTIEVYGSLNLGNLTFSVTDVYFMGKESHTLASLNTITSEVYIQKSESTMAEIALLSHVTIDNDINLISGTLRLSVFTLTVDNFYSNVTTYNRALDMDTGTFVILDYGVSWDMESSKLVITDSPGSTIIFDNDTANAVTFDGGSEVYGSDLTVMGAGAYIFYLYDNNTFGTLTIDRSEAAKTINGNYTSTIDDLEIPISGTTTVTITNSDFSMASGEIYGDYLVISGSDASGGGTFWANAGGHSTNNGGNTGWVWTVPTAPTIQSLDPSDVSYIGMRYNGQITDMGDYGVVYCYFEYGATASYGFETSPQTTLTGTGTFDYYYSPYKIYHYRAAVYYGLGFVSYGADKVVSLSGAVGQATADPDYDSLTAGTPLVDDAPDEPDNLYDEGATGGIPFAPLINPALAEAGIDEETFWYPVAFFIAILLGMLAYGWTREWIWQAVTSAAVMACFAGGGALGDGLIPYFTVVLFVIESVMVLVIKERQTA